MIEIKREAFDDFYDEAQPLALEHWQEVANYRDRRQLEVDYHTYKDLESHNRLYCITARDDGKLVGYSVWTLNTHINYKSWTFAASAAIFVLPFYRKRGVGLRLINKSEEFLKNFGVNQILFRVKPSNDWTPILDRKGYGVEDIVMGKVL